MSTLTNVNGTITIYTESEQCINALLHAFQITSDWSYDTIIGEEKKDHYGKSYEFTGTGRNCYENNIKFFRNAFSSLSSYDRRILKKESWIICYLFNEAVSEEDYYCINNFWKCNHPGLEALDDLQIDSMNSQKFPQKYICSDNWHQLIGWFYSDLDNLMEVKYSDLIEEAEISEDDGTEWLSIFEDCKDGLFHLYSTDIDGLRQNFPYFKDIFDKCSAYMSPKLF